MFHGIIDKSIFYYIAGNYVNRFHLAYQQLHNKHFFHECVISVPVSWLSGDSFVSGAGGLRFKSRFDQIRYSVANGLPRLRHFFERSSGTRKRYDAEMCPANSLHA